MMLSNDHSKTTPPSFITSTSNTNNFKSYSVVRAIQSHQARSNQEFTFELEDCFYMQKMSNNKDYLQVIHPKTKQVGLVPTSKFEMIKSTTPSKSNLRNQYKPSKTILAYVLINCHKFKADDLEACRGDPILILEDVDEHYYLAKLIGKLGLPGKILKENVEIKEELLPSTPALTSSFENQNNNNNNQNNNNINKLAVNLKKNNSTGSTQQRSGINERNKPSLSRRSESTPNAQIISTIDGLSDQLSNWGILGNDLNNQYNSDEHHILDFNKNIIPIASILVNQVINKNIIELLILYSDSSNQIVHCKAEQLQQMHLKLLEQFPKEAGLTGEERKLPYIPTLEEGQVINQQFISELKLYFIHLLNVSSYILKSDCLIDFFQQNQVKMDKGMKELSLEDTTVKNKNKAITSECTQRLNNYGQIKIKLQSNNDMMAFWLKGEELTLDVLFNKIKERLGCLPKSICYVNPENGKKSPLDSFENLKMAVELNPSKLFLVAQ